MLLNIRIQWNAGTACVSECVLKTLACRGLLVGPSKFAKVPNLTRNSSKSLSFKENLRASSLRNCRKISLRESVL